MEQFRIRSSPLLEGELPVRGAKNAVLKALAAALLCRESVTIKNIPLINDYHSMCRLLRTLGVDIKRIGERTARFFPPAHPHTVINSEIAKQMRSSIVLSGPLLAREGEVSLPYPGGCVIGKRPIDVFIDGFRAMGAAVSERKNGFTLRAKRLRGADIFFRVASVTGTETIMMAATLASGKTILRNAAQEPEIAALADFLNACGARISGAGTTTIVINGVRRLRGGTFYTPPDRIEAGSFAILAALLGKRVRVADCNPLHITSLLDALKHTGVAVVCGNTWLDIRAPKKLFAIDVQTREYPGFPTDLQAPFMILLTQAAGKSMVFETVFEGRLAHIHDLNRMGADIVLCDPHRAIVTGPTPLHARAMESPDLRSGLAFIVAALAARGTSTISQIHHIDRGYEQIEERLKVVGAHIERVSKS